MRALFPDAAEDVDPAVLYERSRPPHDDRPWVLANMVTSVDGSATAGDVSGGLSGPGDQRVFGAIRAFADVIVVGVGTVVAESYGPVRGPDPAPIAVVTRSLDLDWDSRFFTEATARPLLLTCEASDPADRARAAAVADVIVAGGAGVDLPAAFAELRRRGHRVALCEGGPTLLAQVISSGLLDEFCLTLAPLVIAGAGIRILNGPPLTEPLRLPLASVLEEDGSLFLRYVRSG